MQVNEYANAINQVSRLNQSTPPNDALREIAGRLKRLSYRDMHTLARALSNRSAILQADLALVLLDVADELEKA